MDELYKAGYSIEEIAVAFDLTFAEVRRAIKDPEPRLCYGAARELAFARGTSSRETLAKLYNTTVLDINTALYNPPRQRPTEPLERTVCTQPDKSTIAEAIVHLHNIGMSTSDIAHSLGIAKHTVYNYKSTLGLTTKSTKLDEAQWAQLLDEYAKREKTVSELSRYYKVSRPAIYKRIKK